MSRPVIALMPRLHRLQMVPLWLTLLAIPFAAAQQISPTQPIQISGYGIDIVLDPVHHAMTVQTTVAFTALRDAATVSFQLNPALRVTAVTDTKGQPLNAERASSDTLGATGEANEIRVTPSVPMKKDESNTWTFTYSGVFDTSRNSGPAGPASAIPLASIGDPVSYLLYPAHWFPTVGTLTSRFTAAMRIHVPADEHVFGSGFTGTPHLDPNGRMVFDFKWPQPGFPGTLIAGKFSGPYAADPNSNVRVYLIEKNKTGAKTNPLQSDAQNYAATAAREYSYFYSQFGPAQSGQLNIVELPDNTVPAYWAPEIAAIAGAQMQGETAFRLLANTIAHQWWGNDVSPATRDDSWITNGMCRYAELQYLGQISGASASADAVLNVSASALEYDTIPLADAAHSPIFSPEFQAMTYDKGAMVFRMLQWQIGDAAFQQTLHDILAQTEKSISSAEVEKIAEAASHKNLQPFFTQWLQSTGAPTLQDKWTLYRLGNNQGFRTVGEIDQDLDLFRMPVEVRVETEGKTVTQRIEVVGAQSQFAIDTFGMPRKISLDPDHWLLRNSPNMQVRVHILRGQQLAVQGDDAKAIQEYHQALAIDNISSLASYRLGDVYFQQKNYQAAANAYRDALRGDGVPKWTEVWSDLQLGKIFDASGQRERAVNQYREALQTQDNTGGALELAKAYLQNPYRTSHP